jgi:hypothetical protein
MAEPNLEERVAVLEKVVAELLRQQADQPSTQKWWEGIAGIMKDAPESEEMKAYGQYIRKTGQLPPDDWKPGDPIPDPDWWGPEPSADGGAQPS